MDVTQKNTNKPSHKNLWITTYWTTVAVLSVSGIYFGVWGFWLESGHNFSNSLYETFQLFFLNVTFSDLSSQDPPFKYFTVSNTLQWSRWLIFAAVVLATFGLFFKIVVPQFFNNLIIRFCYKNHIVICGLNKITIGLAEKFQNEKILVLAEESNKYTEMLKTKGIKPLTGDLSGESFLRKAKIAKASQFYAVTGNDKMNVKAAQTAFTVLEKSDRTHPLKSFILIKDRGLKTILEETALFKSKTDFFDGTLINIGEMGIKYGISMNIGKILPKEIITAPEILLVGLTEKTEIALLNLAHCVTTRRESFKFTVVEENGDKIRLFEKRYACLKDFAEITFTNEIETSKQFTAILICTDNQTDAIKSAVEYYYLLGEKAPNIITFRAEPDIFHNVLNEELKKKRIFLINLFSQIADYVFDLDKNIEDKAKEAHYFWNDIYQMNTEWDALSGHFKQSNRNQILDNYLRIYIARGKKFEDFKNALISFSDYEKETLSMMEHRRWMLEKYENGWAAAGTRDDRFKRHDCLVNWDKLSEQQKSKDENAINLMIKHLNNQSDNHKK